MLSCWHQGQVLELKWNADLSMNLPQPQHVPDGPVCRRLLLVAQVGGWQTTSSDIYQMQVFVQEVDEGSLRPRAPLACCPLHVPSHMWMGAMVVRGCSLALRQDV